MLGLSDAFIGAAELAQDVPPFARSLARTCVPRFVWHITARTMRLLEHIAFMLRAHMRLLRNCVTTRERNMHGVHGHQLETQLRSVTSGTERAHRYILLVRTETQAIATPVSCWMCSR